VRLTEEGDEFLGFYDDNLAGMLGDLFNQVSDAELSQFCSSLDVVLTTLNRLDA
jgi:hypothetical protein